MPIYAGTSRQIVSVCPDVRDSTVGTKTLQTIVRTRAPHCPGDTLLLNTRRTSRIVPTRLSYCHAVEHVTATFCQSRYSFSNVRNPFVYLVDAQSWQHRNTQTLVGQDRCCCGEMPGLLRNVNSCVRTYTAAQPMKANQLRREECTHARSLRIRQTLWKLHCVRHNEIALGSCVPLSWHAFAAQPLNEPVRRHRVSL